MSFPKAPLKRLFDNVDSTVPGPGTYDPKSTNQSSRMTSFNKDMQTRLAQRGGNVPGPGSYYPNPSSETRSSRRGSVLRRYQIGPKDSSLNRLDRSFMGPPADRSMLSRGQHRKEAFGFHVGKHSRDNISSSSSSINSLGIGPAPRSKNNRPPTMGPVALGTNLTELFNEVVILDAPAVPELEGDAPVDQTDDHLAEICPVLTLAAENLSIFLTEFEENFRKKNCEFSSRLSSVHEKFLSVRVKLPTKKVESENGIAALQGAQQSHFKRLETDHVTEMLLLRQKRHTQWRQIVQTTIQTKQPWSDLTSGVTCPADNLTGLSAKICKISENAQQIHEKCKNAIADNNREYEAEKVRKEKEFRSILAAWNAQHEIDLVKKKSEILIAQAELYEKLTRDFTVKFRVFVSDRTNFVMDRFEQMKKRIEKLTFQIPKNFNSEKVESEDEIAALEKIQEENLKKLETKQMTEMMLLEQNRQERLRQAVQSAVAEKQLWSSDLAGQTETTEIGTVSENLQQIHHRFNDIIADHHREYEVEKAQKEEDFKNVLAALMVQNEIDLAEKKSEILTARAKFSEQLSRDFTVKFQNFVSDRSKLVMERFLEMNKFVEKLENQINSAAPPVVESVSSPVVVESVSNQADLMKVNLEGLAADLEDKWSTITQKMRQINYTIYDMEDGVNKLKNAKKEFSIFAQKIKISKKNLVAVHQMSNDLSKEFIKKCAEEDAAIAEKKMADEELERIRLASLEEDKRSESLKEQLQERQSKLEAVKIKRTIVDEKRQKLRVMLDRYKPALNQVNVNVVPDVPVAAVLSKEVKGAQSKFARIVGQQNVHQKISQTEQYVVECARLEEENRKLLVDVEKQKANLQLAKQAKKDMEEVGQSSH